MALVTYILGACPGCGGEKTFGNVDVRRDHVLQGCRRCQYSETLPLPPLKKKVLYLDQFFFSSAFRGNDTRFEIAKEKIEELADLQLLIAPYSTIHETETHLWEHRDGLFKFIKRVSRGNDFYAEWTVEQNQMVRALHSYLTDQPKNYAPAHSDVFGQDFHQWDSYFWIDVGRFTGNIDKIRQLKKEATKGLVDLFDNWRRSNTTFDEDLQAELEVKPRAYLQLYVEYHSRLLQGDVMAAFDSPIASTYVETLINSMPRDWDFQRRIKTCAHFLMSDHFKKTPIQQISARMFATLKAIVKAGNYTNKELALRKFSGFFYDVSHIATYAPYCDAFVVDAPMADILSKRTVNIEADYGCKFFSLRTWDAFLDWLDEIKTDISEEHKRALQTAYPLTAFD